MTSGNGLRLVPDHRAESTVATVTGTLTSANCGALRDGVLKMATDAPTSVIADIRGLDIDDVTLLTVFTVIAVRIDAWPAIPFAVVTDHPDHVAQLAKQASDRFVPVHADVPAAERARDRPPRRRALQLLAASPQSSAVAREFVGRVCQQWQVPEYVDDARLVATELVENTIRHTTSHPGCGWSCAGTSSSSRWPTTTRTRPCCSSAPASTVSDCGWSPRPPTPGGAAAPGAAARSSGPWWRRDDPGTAMAPGDGGITLAFSSRFASAVVTATGELDLSGYGFLRDGLLKVSADGPPALIADIDGLVIGELSPITVFPLVARRMANWPGIPLTLVTRQGTHLRAFRRRGLDRFVTVHDDVEVAESRQQVPARRWAHRKFPRTGEATKLAGAFLREQTTNWGVPELFYGAILIVNELFGNALRHTTSSPELRLDLRQGLLSIAVADENPRPAVLLERTHPRAPGLGLHIVADAATTWGSSRRWSGGKVVWATLAASSRQS